MNYIFIDKKDSFEINGIVKDGKLDVLNINDEEYKNNINNIYRARIEDVIPGMNAAFVDIGEKENAYLSARDALGLKDLYTRENKEIEDIVKAGEEIIVQIKREAFSNKGAKVSRHIELVGKYIIFTPYSKKINISRKIKNKKERKRLYKLGSSILKDNQGMILRTISEDINEEIIELEYNNLKSNYEYIKSQKNFLPVPKLLYRDLSNVEELIRDNFEDIDIIRVNDNSLKNTITKNLLNIGLDIEEKIYFDKHYSIKYDENIYKDINKALSRKIYLKSGASIAIDKTEAMTVIDVNTDSFIGDLSLEETILETNLEATEEIARQIKLRNLSGIIIIDYINMKNDEHIKKVIKSLENKLSEDTIRSNIMGMTKLGLLEITRKRTNRSLDEAMMKRCETCKGYGKLNKGYV